MNLVYRHRSGGELWQGGANDVKLLFTRAPSRISTVGLFAQEVVDELRRMVRPGYELVCLGYDDNFLADGRELDQIRRIADRASDHFADRLRNGKGVLSSCAMGLNRSGLVTAATLVKLGIDPIEAVDLIRKARGPRALSNPSFYRLVQSFRDIQGQKSAWTRWTG